MRRHDSIYILPIQDEIDIIEGNFQHLTYEQLTSDRRVQHMITKALEIIGEASKISQMKQKTNTLRWSGGSSQECETD